jgi:hypothetical protein
MTPGRAAAILESHLGMSCDRIRAAATGDAWHFKRMGDAGTVRIQPDALRDAVISGYNMLGEPITFGSLDSASPAPDLSDVDGPESLRRVIAQALEAGFTVNIRNVDRVCGDLRTLSMALQCLLGRPTSMDLFWSGPDQKGYAPHSDPVAMIVLQISGEKYWRLPDPDASWPAALDRISSVPVLTREVRMRPGDILVLPEGVFHAVHTESESSMHLSIGIIPYARRDALGSILTYLFYQDPSFRTRLRGFETEPGSGPDRDGRHRDIQEAARALAAFCADRDQVDLALSWDRMRWIGDRSPLPARPAGAAGIGPDSSLRVSAKALLWYLPIPGAVLLSYPGGHLKLPQSCVPAIEFLAKAEHFSAAQLPGRLTEESRLLLVNELLRRGVLQQAD